MTRTPLRLAAPAPFPSRVSAALALLVALASACGDAVPAAVAPAAAKGPIPVSAKVGFRAWPHTWEQKTPEGADYGLALAPSGDVVAFSNRSVAVLAREDGRILHSVPLCHPVTPDAVEWITPERLWVVCDTKIVALSFPSLASAAVITWHPENDTNAGVRFNRAAFGGGHVVVGQHGHIFVNNTGEVRVYSTKDATLVDNFEAHGQVETVALWPDGSRVLYATREKVVVRTLADHVEQIVPSVQGRSGYRVAPDGSAVFGPTESFRVGAFHVDGTPSSLLPLFAADSWTTASRWLPGGGVVAVGAEGLVLYAFDGTSSVRAPIEDLGRALGVRDDGKALCASGKRDSVACFFAEQPPPSELDRYYRATFGPRP